MTDRENRTIRNTKVKDSGAKLIFDNHLLCAQFLRGYVGLDLLKEVQPGDIEDVTERFLWMWQEGRDSDSVKKIRLNGQEEPICLIALIEHQSSVDYSMSFRVLRYIVQILTDYEKEQEDKQKGSTRKKNFRYPPILPVVFYDGPGRWTAAENFRDRVNLSDVLGEYIPDFRYLVVPLSRYSVEELVEKGDELSLVMLTDRLRSAADFRALQDIPREYFEELSRKAPESVLRLIGKLIAVLLFRLNVPKDEVEEFTDRIERRDFTMLFENFETYDVQETRRQSRAEGRAEGRAESILELLAETGEVPAWLEKRIRREQNLELLRMWLKEAARAGSLELFLKETGLSEED